MACAVNYFNFVGNVTIVYAKQKFQDITMFKSSEILFSRKNKYLFLIVPIECSTRSRPFKNKTVASLKIIMSSFHAMTYCPNDQSGNQLILILSYLAIYASGENTEMTEVNR